MGGFSVGKNTCGNRHPCFRKWRKTVWVKLEPKPEVICCKPCKRKKKKNGKHPRKTCEEICGAIFQNCNEGYKIYYASLKGEGPAMIQIENGGRSTMLARAITGKNQILAERIEQGQQVSLRVPTLKKLEIACDGEDAMAHGQYVIKLWA